MQVMTELVDTNPFRCVGDRLWNKDFDSWVHDILGIRVCGRASDPGNHPSPLPATGTWIGLPACMKYRERLSYIVYARLPVPGTTLGALHLLWHRQLHRQSGSR